MATIDGSGGDDTITTLVNSAGGATATSGADSIRGLGGADTIDGGDGSDTIEGGAGADSLLGGGGTADWLSYAGSTDGVFIDLLLGTASGGDAAGDTYAGFAGLQGSDAADSLVGDGGINTILGGDGDDAIAGGGDADSLQGGDGDDSILEYVGANTIDGGTGADSILSGKDGDSILGGDDNDTINDIDGRNTIDGGTGADSIWAGDDADSILGGDGADTIDAYDGRDTVDAGGDADLVLGAGGDDSLAGGAGDDTIEGGSGADALLGGAGTGDVLSYAGSALGVTVDLQAGTAAGGDAAGDIFQDVEGLRGGSGADRLAGDGGANALRGGGARDTLQGEGGDDVLRGDGGADSILAGDGNDSVVWRIGDGDDTIDLGGDADTLDLQRWDPADSSANAWAVTVDGTTATFIGDARVGNAVLTVLNYDPEDSVVCFADGTMILTPQGEVPVEQLRIGDLVVTPRGASPVAPLVWVGRLTVDLAHQRFGDRAAPVLVKAGALAEGLPFRDLHVSPNHALFVDDRLVPARLLVNGLTIVRQRWRREVTYHHLELERHGLLVSDGALTESYLDDGNRHLFEARGVVPLNADFATLRAQGNGAACAPVLAEGDAALHAIRMRLGARAGFLQARRRQG